MTQTNTPVKSLQLILPVLFILITTSLSAQQTPAVQKLYAEGGVGGTNHKGLSASGGVQAVWKNNWVTGINYRSIDMNAKNMPRDYEAGYTVIIFLPIPNSKPSINMSIISLEAGKIFTGSRHTWFTTTAGLSLVSADELKFSRRTTDASWYIGLVGEQLSNYSYTEEKKSTIGASLKADFTWAFASFAGLGAGVFANFNSIQSPVGMEVKLIVGKMNREKKDK